jgi:hypothetical protein
LNDYETTWQQLIDAATALESKTVHKAGDDLPIKRIMGRLNLVQPFNWMDWPAPPLSEVDLDQLDINDCVRHFTRLVRGDRFAEGLLASWIRSGHFRKLCEAARRAAAGDRAPSLPKAA